MRCSGRTLTLKHWIVAVFILFGATPALPEAHLVARLAFDIAGAEELSAIELDPTGTVFTMVTDRGFLLRGELNRTDEVLTGLTISQMIPLKGEDGHPLADRQTDSEGIAFGPNGQLYISFEGRSRIMAYDQPEGPALPIRRAATFDSFQSNAGLEALATGPDGTIYTIPERSGRFDLPFPVYRYRNDWDIAFTISRSDSFLVTGADIGPDRKFYLLERDFLGVGFRSRVRRFDMDGTNEETLLQTELRTHSNLEGIAVWRDTTGHIRLTMVSDNGQTFGPSTLVEYQLTD
jgi:hypothetical protein